MRDRYYSLDGMRGLAAIIVVLHHCGLQWGDGLARSGYLAVDFFFALSGFVVAMAYQKRLEEGMSLRAFMTVRFVRLYPLFLLGLGLGVVKAAGQIMMQDNTALPVSEFALSTMLSLAMLPTPGAHLVSIFPLNTPAWSLFFEMVASLVFGIALFRWRPRVLVAVMLAMAVALVGGVIAYGNQGLGTGWGLFVFGFPRLFYAFLLGVLMYRLDPTHQRRGAFEIYIAAAALAAMLFVMPPDWFVSRYEILVLLVGIPLLLRAGIVWEVAPRYRRLFAWLGDISYPIYILHFPLLMMTLFVTRKLAVPDAVVAVGFIVGLVGLSTLLLRFYDAPMRRLLAQWLRVPGSCRAVQPVREAREEVVL